jgi:exopolysaccharide biosynthesis polyprenyl glycosylphosphotransferase
VLNKLVPSTVLALILSETALLTAAYLLAAYRFLDIDPVVWLRWESGAVRIGLVVLVMLLVLYFQDMYTDLRVRSHFTLFQQVCLAIGAAFLFQALLSYAAPDLVLPKWIMLSASLALLVLLPLWRALYSAMLSNSLGAERVLILGGSPVARQVAARYAERPELNRTVVGFVASEPDADQIKEAPVLGPVDRFREVVGQYKPDRIVVGMSERRQRMPVMDLLEVNFSGTPVEDAAVTFESAFGRVCSEQLRPSQLVFSRELGPSPNTLKLQTVYSWLIAAVLVVFLSPVMLLVALAVKLTSKGPALYRQKRMGLNGRVFTVLKFRSMRVDAEDRTGAVWASRNDPRTTSIGGFLRRSRLDELPQLFNVLRGEMSLVGPRPERPEFIATLSERIPYYRQRLCVKPGITGWAQINHRYGDTWRTPSPRSSTTCTTSSTCPRRWTSSSCSTRSR